MSQPAGPTVLEPAGAVVARPPREALDVPVFYNPEPAVARYRAFRGAIVSRLIGLGISLAIWGGIAWLNRDNLDGVFWALFAISTGVSVVLLGRSIVQTIRAKRAIGRLHEGLALGIGRGGIFLEGYLPWDDVDRLVAIPGGGRGSGRLIVSARNGAWQELPIEWLSHTPSALDATVRALSGERHHIELTPLDT